MPSCLAVLQATCWSIPKSPCWSAGKQPAAYELDPSSLAALVSRNDGGEFSACPLRRGLPVLGKHRDRAIGHQVLAEHARLFARGLGLVAAQQRKQRLNVVDHAALTTRQHALDDAALEPARIGEVAQEAVLAHRFERLAEQRKGRRRQAGLVA